MYKLMLTKEELKSLAIVANWYESADILYSHLESPDLWDDATMQGELAYYLPEHIAWEYLENIPHDWSYSNPEDCPHHIPPCIGGTLGEKLADLYERIV